MVLFTCQSQFLLTFGTWWRFILDPACQCLPIFLSFFEISLVKNMHTYTWNTNQAVDVLAKPKNAVCINLIWAEKSITSCARSITDVWWKNSSGWFGMMCLLSNTLRQVVQDAVIEIFSCSAVFVLFWCASVFCLSFFLVMSYWKYMLTASCYTPLFLLVVSVRCEKGQRGFPVHWLIW